MINLGDYIGALVREMTVARVHGDLEAARVVELYRNHPLLRDAPIPRFRLPEVTVEVPVVIGNIEADPKDMLSRPYAPPSKAIVSNVLGYALSSAEISLSPAETQRLNTEMATWLGRRWAKEVKLDDALGLTQDLARAAWDFLAKIRPDTTGTEAIRGAVSSAGTVGSPGEEASAAATLARSAVLESQFRRAVSMRLHTHMLGPLGDALRVPTLASTSSVREVDNASFVTRLNITFREDGFELMRIERDDGRIDERLGPE